MPSPRRLVMIAIVAGVTYYGVTNYGSSLPLNEIRENPVAKQASGNVLGVANGLFSPVASSAARIVSNLVVQKASKPLIQEYEKMRPEQQEIIKKQICK